MSVKRIIQAQDGSVTVRLRGVRLSFPALHKPRAFSADQEAKYQASFLLPKEGDPMENADLVKKAIAAVIKAKTDWKGKSPPPEKLCLRCGSAKDEYDGYDDTVFALSSSNKKAVPVMDTDGVSPIAEDDPRFFAGCYVHATVRLWAQDNKYGKRVNAQLRAVMYAGPGEPFGDAGADPEEEFADVAAAGEELL